MVSRARIGRRVKIVCTLGPATRDPSVLRRLVDRGMDVARLNLSHGTHAEHARAIRAVRRVSLAAGRPIGVLLDLQGPKVRTLGIPGETMTLRRGDPVDLVPASRSARGLRGAIPISYDRLAKDVRRGQAILLDDGLLRLRVVRVRGKAVRCRVVEGGVVAEHKGVNVPGAALSIPPLTPKDRRDVAFGIARGVDLIALSFVQRARDVEVLRALLRRSGRRAAGIPIIAKLEKPQALADLDAILEVSDGVMVARGDLGVEIPPEEVPIVQKSVIERANRARRVVITATQMLESMIERPVPTRAEASDVANAVLDGTDAVMLSGETASGLHPVETVAMMARILERAESAPRSLQRGRTQAGPSGSEEDALAEAVSRMAEETKARLILAVTRSGFTARLISKHRPSIPIVAFAPEEAVRRRLTVLWGVRPEGLPASTRLSSLLARAESALLRKGLARRGDRVVVLTGYPMRRQGTTNLLKIHRIGGARGK